MLSFLGVYLGPDEQLLAAAADNPRGFWEHRGLVAINEEILSTFGGGVHEPPTFPENWRSAPELVALRERAQAVLTRDFFGATLWGWKDPRACLTAPFWQHLLSPMHYIHCLRNPAAAAQSLRMQSRRYGIVLSLEKCIWLWLEYVRSAFTHTFGRPRRLIFYEDVMEDGMRELRNLAAFLERPDRAEQIEVRNALRSFIDHNLQHHQGSQEITEPGGCRPRQRALAMAQRLYDTLRSDAAPGHEVIEDVLRQAQAVIAPEIQKEEQQAYGEQVRLAMRELTALISPEHRFILVEEGQWDATEMPAGPRPIPFLEHQGQYWGKPPDDQTAIRELERLRQAGARFIVFGWPAFWWLDYYAGLHRHLRTHFPCVLENDRLVAFDMRP
jgi:hypothetical protein